ncbi:MAG: biotin/lipoyl-binding protein [Clostridiales bacterium]|nr:biotin/lipoyl-binding protein [Clostridiales bacterium]
MEMKVKRREWVKTAAIIFLVILLVLTFFSNTIMNYSLPEVATQSVQSGTINAKIRGTGTVAANESYEVTVEQSHKVASVLVKEGQEVKVDDVLFRFEGGESDELKAAQDALDQAEQGYEKSLIEAGNAAAKENREIQKARDAYNEALAVYQQYSTMSASQIATKLAEAEIKLKDLQIESSQAQQDYDNAKAEYDQLASQISGLETDISGYEKLVASAQSDLDSLEDKKRAADSADAELTGTKAAYGENYDRFLSMVGGDSDKAAVYAADLTLMRSTLGLDDATATAFSAAFKAISEATAAKEKADNDLSRACRGGDYASAYAELESEKTSAENNLADAEGELRRLKKQQGDEDYLNDLKYAVTEANQAVTDQQAEYDKLSKASSAAATMKSAKDTLENLVFEQNLADSASVDMKAAKESIEKQRKNVEKLQKESEGGEVKSPVNGTISSLAISAGQTANAGTTLAKIDVTDRGYTLKIPVTNEQAKKVTIGEKAELVNFWWGGDDISATLESIGTDPANPSSGKQLTFRLDGAVEPGQSITLSIGQKSANYDCLVPNSAVRSDNNGSFVLLVTSKSSPLGNRYTATRVSVNVLASDDTSTAVTGLSAGDFVLTTSSKPVSSGMQVRLADES